MRGVVENDASYAREPAVGIYIDDVYHSTVVGSALNLADIDHIEVKLGPQGTLEGNASIGGSISLYSKLPKGDNTGYLEATYGSFNKMQLDGAFDTTIAPDLFMRVSGSFEHQDGYVDVLDFACEMNARGTPQLAGTLPSSSPGSYQRGCKVDEEGGYERFLGQDDVAVCAWRQVRSQLLHRLLQERRSELARAAREDDQPLSKPQRARPGVQP